MEKKVGKFIVICALLFSSIVQAAHSSIVLSIQGMDGKPIKQAMVHSQFILQVSVNNIDVRQDISYVHGMDRFSYALADHSSNISIYNGQTISKFIYKFVMRADDKGTYSVGPLSLTDKHKRTFDSNTLSIKVDDQVIVSHNNPQAEKSIVMSSVDKKTMYVGEKVILNVDFLDSTGIDQYSLIIPDFEKLIVTDVQQKPVQSIQHANGQEYADTQWAISLYPKSIGFAIVEGFKIRYVDSQVNNNFFGRAFFAGGFASLMNFEQELYIHPIGLQVLDLPKEAGFENVVAVGNFSEITITVNKNSMVQGQGLVLIAKIVGDGNFEMIESLPLLLPDGCAYYDSGSPQLDTKRTHKNFEYIIQAQAAGQYHIPAQQFHYFDPVDRQYKTIQSNSIDVVVTENPIEQKINDQQLLDEQSDENDTEHSIMDYAILEQGSLRVKSFIVVPFLWYLRLLYFLYFILFFMMVYRYGIQKYIVENQKIRRMFIFFQAQRSCYRAMKNNDVIALYSMFMNLFIQLKVFSAGRIHHEMIEQYLKNKGFSDVLITQWKQFYHKISQASFTRYNKKNNDQLFQEALVWLQRLKE